MQSDFFHRNPNIPDEKNQTAFIPNEEIRQELMKAVKRKKWNEWMSFQQESDACSQSGI